MGRCAYWGFKQVKSENDRLRYERYECGLDSRAEWRGIALCARHHDLAESKLPAQQDALEKTLSGGGRCRHGIPNPWVSCSMCGIDADRLAEQHPNAVVIPRRSHAGGHPSATRSDSLKEYWAARKAAGRGTHWTEAQKREHVRFNRDFWTPERRAAHAELMKRRNGSKRN